MRRLLIEWNLILLRGDDEDFLGCSVLALLFAGVDFDCEVEAFVLLAVEENWTMGEDELFIRDGGVVLNCNQSR